jgi:hypothetical protein
MSRFLAMIFGPRAVSPDVDMPAHTPGTHRGEGWVIHSGREPGRQDPGVARTARDSTGINANKHGPIHPRMPHIPPA